MAYQRGGVFRSRFIAPRSQRATEILSKPLISQVTLAFDAGAADTTTSVLPNETIALALTAAEASGRERLVIAGGLSTSASADFSACTIDGQVATRVGTVSRGVGTAARVFLTAFRAPGTTNTAISIGLTRNATGTVTTTFAACWKMNYAGAVFAQTSSSGNDPTLSVNTANKGAVAGGSMGYGPSSPFSGATDAFVWSGLTERYEYHAALNAAFAAASDDIVSASTPLAITLNITPNLTTGNQSKASLAISFNPIVLRSVAALEGNYLIDGDDCSTLLGFFVSAATAAYAITGTATTLGGGRRLNAAAASYALTGVNANPNPSAGATASSIFDAAVADGTDKTSTQTYTFPLTVAAATGERLVIVGGIAGTDGDYSACTIDGLAATRVGSVSRGVADSSDYTSFLTAFRAAGTASTSINVVATVSGTLKTQTSGYCAGFRLNGAGNVYAATNNNINDPVLSSDVVNNGTLVAALLGYADAAPPSVAWSGLTERFDSVSTVGTEVFSGASVDISSASGAVVPTFRALASTTYAARSSLTTVDKPSGTLDGDIMIATLMMGSATLANIVLDMPPSGWTQIGATATSTEGAGDFFGKLMVFWKRASGEAASYDFAHSNTLSTQAAIASYSGCVRTGSPIDAFQQDAQNTSIDGNVLLSGITTTVANTRLVYTGNNWTGNEALSPPTGFTERFDSIVYLADASFAGPGATGTMGQVLVGNYPWQAYLIALTPSVSPRPISADITPDLTTVGSDSIASICLSFRPSGAAGSALQANIGSYLFAGTAALAKLGRKTAAAAGSYAMTGTAAAPRTLGKVITEAGSYALTGTAAATIRGGTNKIVDAATPGSYTITGSEASGRKGRKIAVTTVGSYGITGTTVLTGKGLLAVAGSYAVNGRDAVPVKVTLPGYVSISIGAPQLTATAGTVTAIGNTGAGVLVSGSSMTVSDGSVAVAVSGGIAFPVSAPELVASLGGVSVTVVGGTQSVEVTGLEMTAADGTVEVVIPGQVQITTTDSMVMAVGTPIVEVLGSVTVLLFGNGLTARMGNLDGGLGEGTITTVANISVTGDQMTAEVGSVIMTSPNIVTVTSPTLTADVGSVTVTAKRHVTVTVEGNAMVAYVGNLRFAGGGTVVYLADQVREGQMLRPSNWMGG